MSRLTEHRIDLPWPRPPAGLEGNARVHWRTEHKAKAMVRQTVTLLARAARIPHADHLTVQLVWAPGDNRRRDADNLWPLLKICCDCLARGPRRDWVGLELVPDDTPKWMTKLAPHIEPPPARGMWLHVTAHHNTGEVHRP
jgi:crossover junction endodeoxyribonuclease RusA